MARPNAVERTLEWLLFASRWLMAPVYLGLVVALAALLVAFVAKLISGLPHLVSMTQTEVVIWLLGLVDLSLVGNLLMTVILAGYENFVSKMEAKGDPDWPEWIGKVDFGGMKLKLIGSIAAISSIYLLEVALTPAKLDLSTVGWLLAIQLTIILSGVLLAAMDYISEAGRHMAEK